MAETPEAETTAEAAPPADIVELSEWVSSRVRADEADLAPAITALRECVLAWEGYRLELATFIGVSVNESTALSYLVARGPMPISELAGLLGFGSGSATLLVDRLEAKGLLVRSADPGDRRRTIVEATASSHEHLKQMRMWPAVVYADLEPQQVREYAAVLEHVGERLREFAGLVAGAQAPVAPPKRRQ
ncbi:MarR family winged helix-turn-helix transcriptional regulator [Lapillicoccus jejuensis]|uniref:DNA-binding MarR family transcriptional regulator n=1 Tax=Lapillicoccus jejuensis TaxID=402171 RepID=A0A542E3Q4_9MICO|nr:MarR family transcriptional regulator [Lapillicoccus jejuensis]TQJ09929.1 DNA-binding MarR family transcriptional regulator [Lapillicoccus jejuensis]